MLDKFHISKYFYDDMLALSGHHHNWPSVFFGPNGSGSGLHIDSMCTAFTMTQAVGHKLWLAAPFSQLNYLRKLVHENTTEVDMVDQDITVSNLFLVENYTSHYIDVFAPNFTAFPHAPFAAVFGGVLQPGDTVFLPSRWLHTVKNLDNTIGIARNFIPTSPGGYSDLLSVCPDADPNDPLYDGNQCGGQAEHMYTLCKIAKGLQQYRYKEPKPRNSGGGRQLDEVVSTNIEKFNSWAQDLIEEAQEVRNELIEMKKRQGKKRPVAISKQEKEMIDLVTFVDERQNGETVGWQDPELLAIIEDEEDNSDAATLLRIPQDRQLELLEKGLKKQGRTMDVVATMDDDELTNLILQEDRIQRKYMSKEKTKKFIQKTFAKKLKGAKPLHVKSRQ